MRNDIDVSFETMNVTFKLATDEGTFHGEKGIAPPPLALFTTLWLDNDTNKTFGKKLHINVN